MCVHFNCNQRWDMVPHSIPSLFTHLTAVADMFSMHICQRPDKLMHICDGIFNSNHATCHRLRGRHMPLKIKRQLICCSSKDRCYGLQVAVFLLLESTCSSLLLPGPQSTHLRGSKSARVHVASPRIANAQQFAQV